MTRVLCICFALLTGGCSGVTHKPQITTHNLQISRHTSVGLTDTRADQILADMSTVLNMNDGMGDVACNVGFERDGSLTTFSATGGMINSSADFDAVNGLPGNIKVVTQINWCGSLAPGIIGCAPVPGDSLVVIRFGTNQEGILWLHEFGHNQGLDHRNDAGAVMQPSIGSTHRRINSSECAAYEMN